MLDNLSKHPVQEIINKVLKNDCKKALDQQAFNQFNTTLLRVCAYGSSTTGTDTTAVVLSTAGTMTVTNSVNMHKNHIKSIVDVMKERNIPEQCKRGVVAKAANDNYVNCWKALAA